MYVDCLSEIKLQEQDNSTVSDIEVLRTGTIHDRDWKITKDMLSDYVNNYKNNVYGTEVPVNCEHRRGSEAAGWVQDLFIDGNKLMCRVEWTEMGVEKITKKLFKFVSAELAYEYPHHKTGDLVKNVFIGLALTNTPALKRQKALELSEQLLSIKTTMFEIFIKSLKERAFVSKQDKEVMKAMLEELPEEEREKVKDDVAEVEAKPEEEKPADPGKPAEKPEGGENKENLSDKNAVQKLTEKLNKTNEELSQAKDQLKQINLKDSAVKKYLITKDRKVGFQEVDLQEVVNFTATLSEEQLKAFDNVFNKLRAVDLEVIGTNTKTDQELSEDQAYEAAEKEAKEMSQKTGRALHECLSEVYKAKGLTEKE